MPFGVVFAALVLGIVGPWYGYSTFFSSSATPDRIAAVVWALGGICIAAALLSRRRGARACGIAASLLLAIEGIRLVVARGEPLEAMLFLAGLTSAVLLLVPRLASVALVAAVTTLAAAIPGALVLASMGGATDPGSSRAALAVVLVTGWLAGLGLGLLREGRRARPVDRPVS